MIQYFILFYFILFYRNRGEAHHVIQNQTSNIILNANNHFNDTSSLLTPSSSTPAKSEDQNKSIAVGRIRRSHEISSFIFHKGREGVRTVNAECSSINGCIQPESKTTELLKEKSVKTGQNGILPHKDIPNKLEYLNFPTYNRNAKNIAKNENGLANSGSRRIGRNEKYYETAIPDWEHNQAERMYYSNNLHTATTERLYPVYIPEDSKQNQGRNHLYSDGSSSNPENAKPQSSLLQYSPNQPDGSEQIADRGYSEVSSKTDSEPNSDVSNRGDLIYSEGSAPFYIPKNSEPLQGRTYKEISSEDVSNLSTSGLTGASSTSGSSPVYIPDRYRQSEDFSGKNYERNPGSQGTREMYFSEYSSPVYNSEKSKQDYITYSRNIPENSERYSYIRGKEDRILATGPSKTYDSSSSGRSETEEERGSSNVDNYPIQTYTTYEEPQRRISSQNDGDVYSQDDKIQSHAVNEETAVSTQIEPNEKAEGRANGNDAVATYYDFLINEGSYKFWAVFQVITALLLIYSAFAAIYYAKYTFSQMDYPDYLDDGFFFKRSGDIYATTTSTAKPESFSFLGLSPQTFQRIMNAISSKEYS